MSTDIAVLLEKIGINTFIGGGETLPLVSSRSNITSIGAKKQDTYFEVLINKIHLIKKTKIYKKKKTMINKNLIFIYKNYTTAELT